MTEPDGSLVPDILRELPAQPGDMILGLSKLGGSGANQRRDRFDHRLDRICRLGLIEA